MKRSEVVNKNMNITNSINTYFSFISFFNRHKIRYTNKYSNVLLDCNTYAYIIFNNDIIKGNVKKIYMSQIR